MLLNNELYDALNVSNITDLLDTYVDGNPALVDDPLLDSDFTGDASINFYMTSPLDTTLAYSSVNYSLSCRDITLKESQTIATTVVDNINRVNYTDYFITCSVLQTIPPQDSTDNYNTPVEILIRKK